jgi:hypothetical protein
MLERYDGQTIVREKQEKMIESTHSEPVPETPASDGNEIRLSESLDERCCERPDWSAVPSFGTGFVMLISERE